MTNNYNLRDFSAVEVSQDLLDVAHDVLDGHALDRNRRVPVAAHIKGDDATLGLQACLCSNLQKEIGDDTQRGCKKRGRGITEDKRSSKEEANRY